MIKVDVRDLAIAHIKVLSTPAAANQRFIIGTKTCSPAAVVKVICEHFPALQDRCAKDTGADTTPPFFFDDGSTVKALDISFRPFEETFVDTTTRILELEKKLGG